MVELIARQSADILNIVDDLLTVTRLEAGTMSVHLQAIDVLDQVGALVETLARDGGRKIEWSGNTRVWADPTRTRVARSPLRGLPPCSIRSSIGTTEVARPTLSALAWRLLEASLG